MSDHERYVAPDDGGREDGQHPHADRMTVAELKSQPCAVANLNRPLRVPPRRQHVPPPVPEGVK